MSFQDYTRGRLIGGNLSDAPGWPVEFMSFSEIKTQCSKGIFSNGTQMALFSLLLPNAKHL